MDGAIQHAPHLGLQEIVVVVISKCSWLRSHKPLECVAIIVVILGLLLLNYGRRPGSAPGGAPTCSLLRQRKVGKRKATPSPCPCAALRAPSGAQARGGAAELALFTAFTPLRHPQQARSRSKGILQCPCPPLALRSSARPKGWDPEPGHCFARPRMSGAGETFKVRWPRSRPSRRQSRSWLCQAADCVPLGGRRASASGGG